MAGFPGDVVRGQAGCLYVFRGARGCYCATNGKEFALLVPDGSKAEGPWRVVQEPSYAQADPQRIADSLMQDVGMPLWRYDGYVWLSERDLRTLARLAIAAGSEPTCDDEWEVTRPTRHHRRIVRLAYRNGHVVAQGRYGAAWQPVERNGVPGWSAYVNASWLAAVLPKKLKRQVGIGLITLFWPNGRGVVVRRRRKDATVISYSGVWEPVESELVEFPV